MLIDCPACFRSYHVSRAEIGGDGRSVICPRCDARWFVHGEDAGALIPLPNDLPAQSFTSRPVLLALPKPVAPERRPVWRGVGSTVTVAACLLLAGVSIGARDHFVRAIPRMEAVYETMGLPVNLAGLKIAAVVPPRVEGVPVAVTGTIRNVASHRVAIPRLVYEARDAQGAPLESWTEPAPERTLATQRSVPFVSSPHQLPAEARSILIRFAAGDDAGVPLKVAAGTP